MFLFFFELAIALQSPEEQCVFGRKSKRFKMAEKTGVLSSSRFRLTNTKVLSLLFTEYPLVLPSLARKHIFDRFQVFSVFIGGSN